jgi:hypothetical protein
LVFRNNVKNHSPWPFVKWLALSCRVSREITIQ